jgi:hypothetical protein
VQVKAIADFKKGVVQALKAAGYPPKADPIAPLWSSWRKIVAILSILVIYVTVAYGPIAAMLGKCSPPASAAPPCPCRSTSARAGSAA